MKWLRRAGIVLAILGVPFLIVWHEPIWWWIEVHTGTVHESGPFYGFFSGFGSDLGEYAILTAVGHGVYLHWQAINCHNPGCWRVGKYPIAGGQYKVCARCHPDGKPERHHILAAHRAHQERMRRANPTIGTPEGP